MRFEVVDPPPHHTPQVPLLPQAFGKKHNTIAESKVFLNSLQGLRTVKFISRSDKWESRENEQEEEEE